MPRLNHCYYYFNGDTEVHTTIKTLFVSHGKPIPKDGTNLKEVQTIEAASLSAANAKLQELNAKAGVGTQIVINAKNITDYIIRFEEEGLPDDEVLVFIQYLIDSGMAWTLQGFYGRMAHNAIVAGLCKPAQK